MGNRKQPQPAPSGCKPTPPPPPPHNKAVRDEIERDHFDRAHKLIATNPIDRSPVAPAKGRLRPGYLSGRYRLIVHCDGTLVDTGVLCMYAGEFIDDDREACVARARASGWNFDDQLIRCRQCYVKDAANVKPNDQTPTS